MQVLTKLSAFLILISLPLNAGASEQTSQASEESLIQNVWEEDVSTLEQKFQSMKKNDFVHARCSMGLTILHHAAVTANIPMLELIIKNWIAKGLDLDELAGRKGTSPAHSALQLLSEKTPELGTGPILLTN
ncbi:MAG: hypothetical protein HRU09_19985 [Oligoflexales bacterium]|nr:hypothetical protein [Oligoflexales bacterium]